jgi:large subunit ribosomal protein L10
LNKETKEQIVSHISSKLKQATFAILTGYRGLTVEQITRLRNELRGVSSDYQVVKNTLFKIASKGTEFEQLHQHFAGPTAILLSSDDPIAPSKILAKFLKEYSVLSIKAGFLQGKVLSVKKQKSLAPSLAEKSCLQSLFLSAFHLR